MPKGISKGETLILLDQQGVIDINKTMVFLGAPNDISMFQVTRTNVVVLKSYESLIKIVDIKFANNTEDYIYSFAKSLKL